jgi:hypothetical protein
MVVIQVRLSVEMFHRAVAAAAARGQAVGEWASETLEVAAAE